MLSVVMMKTVAPAGCGDNIGLSPSQPYQQLCFDSCKLYGRNLQIGQMIWSICPVDKQASLYSLTPCLMTAIKYLPW